MNKKYKRPSLPRFMLKSMFVIAAMFTALLAVAVDNTDDFLFVLASTKKIADDTFGRWADSLKNEESKGTDASVMQTTTKGIDLSLIDEIEVNTPTKGYIKELLTILRDAQNKKITSKKVSVTTVLGSWSCEHALYDGCPKFYFKPKDWKENDPNYSFAGYTSNSRRNSSHTLDKDGVMSIMQWTNKAESEFTSKAKCDPVGNTRKYKKGDLRYLPDICQYYTGRESTGRKYSYAGLATEFISGFAVGSNNRGDAGFSLELAGGCYGRTPYLNKPQIHLKVSKAIRKENTLALNEGFEGAIIKSTGSSNWEHIASGLCSIFASDQGSQWFISEIMYNELKGEYKNAYTNAYKKFVDKQATDAEAMRELKKHANLTLAESINKVNGTNITGSDTETVYGTSNDYKECTIEEVQKYGYVWFVSKSIDKSGTYKHTANYKNPYGVMAFDGICFQQIVGTLGGKRVYAQLLKKAGVKGVDPSNEATYCKTTVVTQRVTPNATWTGDLSKNLLKYVDQSKLTDDRKVILQVAEMVANSKKWHYAITGPAHLNCVKNANAFVKGSNSSSKCTSGRTRYVIECSGFVSLVYHYAGFGRRNYGLADSFFGSSTYWKEVDDWNDMRPGDIVSRRSRSSNATGHVEIFLGIKGGKVWTIGAHGHEDYTCDKSISIDDGSKSDWMYKVQYRNIDKNKRGKDKIAQLQKAV